MAWAWSKLPVDRLLEELLPSSFDAVTTNMGSALPRKPLG